jgi:hypothetical protein
VLERIGSAIRFHPTLLELSAFYRNPSSYGVWESGSVSGTAARWDRRRTIFDWFKVHLPNPPFYDDGNTAGAITWFKRSSTEELRQRLHPLCHVLNKYGVLWHAAESADPGTIIYEDEFQVGVIPYQRFEPTAMPRDMVLGPTTAGSKRHLGKRARRGLS